jgi:hypothetical protein
MSHIPLKTENIFSFCFRPADKMHERNVALMILACSFALVTASDRPVSNDLTSVVSAKLLGIARQVL